MANITIHIHHLVFAFLCPNNRTMTMEEYKCGEMELFENPTYLLHHYFKNSGIVLNEADQYEIEIFLSSRNGKQIAEAFLCPVNRHCTRVEYNCCDGDFIVGKNYERLIIHYVVNGGADAFAKKREGFLPDSPNCK